MKKGTRRSVRRSSVRGRCAPAVGGSSRRTETPREQKKDTERERRDPVPAVGGSASRAEKMFILKKDWTCNACDQLNHRLRDKCSRSCWPRGDTCLAWPVACVFGLV